ncbi:NAD(P)/FAD-dependent oxidoreductase [Ramlibacter solisilvae]|uniref:Monoamine oxidase n=1 Tax=Ramlibacter tataouinensis TaxID=94132 RepID=A0A127JVU8_9BURK|nr:NAD(P)/FAD-dependent oxidoreductase [Ramlibacter tataouinensis]AMO24110.1 monoamine oxidase [Ramlibacter tataouinensis]
MKQYTQDRESAAPQGVSRRGFMRRAGAAGAVAAGALGAANAATPGPQRKARAKGVDYDVIVLGGGFAGVTAARDSMKNGYKTLLLEARDRLGGRTWTKEFEGHKVEMGGTWIHWTQPFVWSEVQRYKLEVEETPDGKVEPGAELRVLVDGRCEVLNKLEQLAPVLGAINKYFADAGQYWERPYDASFQWSEILKADKLNAGQVVQKMNLTPIQRVAVEAYAAGLSHGPLEQVSYLENSRWWALPGSSMTALHDSCGRYKFKHGTVSLINKMVEDGRPEIRLSTPVKSVEEKGDHVVVTTASGQHLTAAAVIVGLPMNVVHNVQFMPALDPLVAEAGRERHAGTGIKLLIKVKGHVTKTRVSAVAPPTHPLSFLATYSMAEDHTIFVMFGPDPKHIDYTDKAAVQKALRDYFPEAVVEAVDHQAWTEDPYARGTWCNYKPGWFAKYYEHFQKDRGRVFFGQGDHGEGWRGFIDGAIGAGGAAALRVKTRLG